VLQSTLRSILLPLTQTSQMAYPLQSLVDAAISSLFADAGHIQMRTTYSLLGAVDKRRKAVTAADASADVPVRPIDQVVVDVVRDMLAPLGLLKDVFTDQLRDASNDYYGGLVRNHSPFEPGQRGQLAPVVNHALFTAAALRSDEALYAQLHLSSDTVAVLLKAVLKTMLPADRVPQLVEDGFAALLVGFAPLSSTADAKGKGSETAEQRESQHGLATLAALVRRIDRGSELRGPWGDWVRKQVESVICDPVNGLSDARSTCASRSLADPRSSSSARAQQTPRWCHRCSRSARRSRLSSAARSRCPRRPSRASGTRTSSCAMRAQAPSRPAWAAVRTSRLR
jgi:hypothetical protein